MALCRLYTNVFSFMKRTTAIIFLRLLFIYLFIYLFFFLGLLLHGCFQTRGRIGAAAASLHYSHSNTRSKLHLQPTLQLTATPDP